ncbi:ArsR/SmtB family transcription factor [Intestinibacter sp.]|uniref:ArsR/SmtB family transcription factor n=1 Tax=Intestinibacter sp. TaxID=1965304 RepID=UPI002A7640F6|nr:helix-turn-helix domain-containing protein [Intestinibacter sp.]MDY2736504.1 helix-turn-helix domain-containing protein [Intestinibacter sp.]
MKDLLVLRDLECVKAIAHPRRIDILNAFDKEPLSAKQLSEMLDEPHAKINYHIKTLYNVGILELVEEKIKSGIVEKYYYPTANNVVMSRKIIDYTLDPASEEGTVSISDFENTVENFYDAVEQGTLKLDKVLEYRNIQLTDAEIAELQDTMKAKVSEILANRKENDEQKKHDLVMVAIPTDLNDDVTE